MKKAYVKPSMESEAFVPNTYVAACDGVVTWRINCNVPTGFGFYDNNHDGEYNSGDTKLTPDGSSGCGVWHENVVLPEGQTPADGMNAMWQPQKWEGFIIGNYVDDGDAYPVFCWRDGSGKYDIHFTEGRKGNWEKNHS